MPRGANRDRRTGGERRMGFVPAPEVKVMPTRLECGPCVAYVVLKSQQPEGWVRCTNAGFWVPAELPVWDRSTGRWHEVDTVFVALCLCPEHFAAMRRA